MKIPGFTAELTLYPANQQYQNINFIPRETGATITPAYFGGHHCFWQCYPGSGCEYKCYDLPY